MHLGASFKGPSNWPLRSNVKRANLGIKGCTSGQTFQLRWGGSRGLIRGITPLNHMKVTLFTMILCNSENSIHDIRLFCRPFFCHSSVVKVYFISFTVVNPSWDLTAKYYWNRPPNLTGWIRPCSYVTVSCRRHAPERYFRNLFHRWSWWQNKTLTLFSLVPWSAISNCMKCSQKINRLFIVGEIKLNWR